MSSCLTQNSLDVHSSVRRLNPAELKIDLFCSGLRMDKSCRIEQDGSFLQDASSVPADGGNGLEIILPGPLRDVWVNAPVRERFVRRSPYLLSYRAEGYVLLDERNGLTYNVRLPRKPKWYNTLAPSGIPMSRIGALSGTYLSVYLDDPLDDGPKGVTGCPRRIDFRSVPNGGSVADVVETASTAQRQSGVTLVLLRGAMRGVGGIPKAFPYVKALKENVGILVGLQFPPEEDLSLIDEAHSLGVDHFSFTVDFYNFDYATRSLQSKPRISGADGLSRAVEYCAKSMGKGKVSCGIIAGRESVKDTYKAIDYLAGIGVIPLVRIFRPLINTETESDSPPRYEDMLSVCRYVYDACRRNNLPVGILPNVHVSILIHPEDTLYFADNSEDGQTYARWIHTMKQVMRPYYQRRMRKYQSPRKA